MYNLEEHVQFLTFCLLFLVEGESNLREQEPHLLAVIDV